MGSCKTCEEEPASCCQRLLQEVGHRRLLDDSEVSDDTHFKIEFCKIMGIAAFEALAEEVARGQAREWAARNVRPSDVRKGR
jgi:hypothetical protein